MEKQLIFFMEFNMCIDKSLFLKYSNFIKEISGGVIMFANLTPDGKIKTIRYLKATHDDFAKLVKEGKKMIKDVDDMEKKTGISPTDVEKLVEENPNKEIEIDGEKKTVLWLYTYYVNRKSILEGYNRAYKFLMEEGVDELLFTIGVGSDSYDYNFYKFCLDAFDE